MKSTQTYSNRACALTAPSPRPSVPLPLVAFRRLLRPHELRACSLAAVHVSFRVAPCPARSRAHECTAGAPQAWMAICKSGVAVAARQTLRWAFHCASAATSRTVTGACALTAVGKQSSCCRRCWQVLVLVAYTAGQVIEGCAAGEVIWSVFKYYEVGAQPDSSLSLLRVMSPGARLLVSLDSMTAMVTSS